MSSPTIPPRIPSPSRPRARPLARCLALGLALGFGSGCRTFNVDVGTSEPIRLDPIQVDLNMRVDIHQHTGRSEDDKAADVNRQDAATRIRDRMAEIQELKNNRFVGENHLGLLSIREVPAGDYGEYVRRTVDAENADRVFVMTDRVNRSGALLADIQADQWSRRVQTSFPGEWIEVPGDTENTFRWEKKGGE